MAKAKKVEKPKKSIHPTREEKEMYVLDLLNDHKCLAFTELWQIADGETDSPFQGGSESTLRRAVKALAKLGKVNLPRTPKGAILVELPSVTAANEGWDENPPDVNGGKPAGETTGTVPAGADDSALDEMAKRAVDRGMREIEEELSKPPVRPKTKAELQEEVGYVARQIERLTRSIQALQDRRQKFVSAIEIYDDLQTDRPLPPTVLERVGKILLDREPREIP